MMMFAELLSLCIIHHSIKRDVVFRIRTAFDGGG